MTEQGPGHRILESFRNISKRSPKSTGDSSKVTEGTEPIIYDLRTFVETYITSLSNIIRAFPSGNLDINALEAHLWDRIRYFFKYESFDAVRIDTREEIEFINKVIASIEDWFYGADWTSCLVTPGDAEIRTMLSHGRKTFLKRVRDLKDLKDREKYPSLGRDSGRPLPNIYDEVANGLDPTQVYEKHAFKFFHGPAAVINTVTKISIEPLIMANRSRFEDFIREVTQSALVKLKEWGYEIDDPNRGMVNGSMTSLNGQHSTFKRCRRTLFFMKTCLEAAEMIRRTGHSNLTKEDFENILLWINNARTKQKLAGRNMDFLPFNFAESSGFAGSTMHVNAKELPLALMAVDYLYSKKNHS